MLQTVSYVCWRLTASRCPMRLGRIFRFCSWSVGVHGFGTDDASAAERCAIAGFAAESTAALAALLRRRC